MRALATRPAIVGVLVFALAWALFAVRVTTPHTLVFDEIHYVTAARWLLTLEGPRNIEHPLLAKEIIALGIRLFGDGPLGWRFFSTVAGAATVAGCYAIVWLLSRRLRPALIAAALTALNFTVFVQARIAMLDGFMTALLVAALATMLWARDAPPAASRRRWLAASVVAGLAVACKWAALPYLGFAAIAFLWMRRGRRDRWRGIGVAGGLATLALASAAAYLATFWPAFLYADEPLTLARLLPFQLDMYRQQTQVLPPHTYQSAWWSWPIERRPIWYFYEPADGAQRGILMLGNPTIVWGGLVAVVAAGWAWARRGERIAGGLALLWLSSWLMFAAIPKSLGFFYYYYPSTIWLGLVIAAVLDHYCRGRYRDWDEAFVLLAAVLFVHFYPILAATPLAGPQSFNRWMWFDRWR